MKYRAVFFDFDGTLFHLNIDWKKLKKNIFFRLKINNINLSLFTVLNSIKNESLKNEIFDELKQTEIRGSIHAKEINGAKKFLLNLKKKDVKTAIISRNSKQSIKYVLEKNKFPYVDLLIGREDVRYLKPHPEALFKAINYFHVSKKEICYIGDNPIIDYQFVHDAGVKFILFTNWQDIKKLINI